MKFRSYFPITICAILFLVTPHPALSQLPSGDVAPLGNNDGMVNVGDALVALRFALGLETPTQQDIWLGDVAPLDANNYPDPDGEITVGDALVILREALGLVGWIISQNSFNVDNDGDGYTENNGDCNDTDPTIHSGATEICNDSKDNDCDGAIDCTDPNCSSDPACPTGTDNGTIPTCKYYVAPNGNDETVGTETQPWATFQHAADTAQPGDTICFRGGTYPSEEIHLTVSGTAEAPITFIACSGESPILDGEGNAGELLILDQYTSYVRISGFTLRNFTIWGMELSGENRYVHLDHLEVEGGEAAIRFTYGESAESAPSEGPVEHITLEDSIIHGSEYSAVDCTPGPCNNMEIRRVEIYNTGLAGEAFFGSDGLEFARGYPVLVEDCYVHDNGGDGIDLNSRDRQGNATGVIVRRNRVVRNHLNGIKLWAGGRIENNVVWGQGLCAVWAGSFPSTLEIFNNTIAYNMWDPAYSERDWALVIGYPEEMPKPPVALTLVNNIFAFNADPCEGGSTGIYLGPGVTLAREQNNLYWSREDGEITAEYMSGHDVDFSRAEIADGTWTQFSGQGLNDLTVDPLFVSGWSGIDLQLQKDSPAVNAGAADGAPTEDVEGRARDTQPDIGAYEYTF